MQRLADPLRLMGAQIDNNFAPLTVSGGALRGIEYAIPVASAQVKAALLLAALHASGPTTLREPGPSRDHSERMLRALGVDVRSQQNFVTLYPLSAALPASLLTLPADMSAAAFMLAVAVLVPGSSIQLQGVGINPTRTGFLEALQEMGADIRITNQREEGGEPVADLEARHSALRAIEIGGARVVRMIDEFPVFAVLATQAAGRTVVRDAAELRLKESDRITVLAGELRKLGVVLSEQADGFELHGPQAIQPAAVASHGDHRLAMSLAIAGLLAPGTTTVAGADAVDESFPGFGAALQQLGAAIEADPA
jgi:3-phosphoshikimate 1-carboxyvinyltransferase